MAIATISRLEPIGRPVRILSLELAALRSAKLLANDDEAFGVLIDAAKFVYISPPPLPPNGKFAKINELAGLLGRYK